MNNNISTKNKVKNNNNPLKSAFTLFGLLLLLISLGIISIILYEQKIPSIRKIFVSEIIGIIGTIFALWLIMSLRGKTVDIIGNEIDVAMIAFIIIILLLIFGNI